jgi:hypothetical protein
MDRAKQDLTALASPGGAVEVEEFSAGSDAGAWVEGRSIGAYPEPTRKTNQHATISAKMTFSGGTVRKVTLFPAPETGLLPIFLFLLSRRC